MLEGVYLLFLLCKTQLDFEIIPSFGHELNCCWTLLAIRYDDCDNHDHEEVGQSVPGKNLMPCTVFASTQALI